MKSLPTLNMIGWSILQYELAYDGLNRMVDGGNSLLTQPRAVADDDWHPGAAFIASIVEGQLDWCVTDLIDSLKAIRFPDAEDDDRRVRLLLRYELDNPGMEVPALIQFALDQSVREPA